MGSTGARRRLPRWAKALLWAGGIVVVLVAAAVVWFIAMLYGGLDDLFGDPRSPDDPAVLSAEEETRPVNQEALTAAVRTLADASGPVTVIARTSGDYCHVGQHNWKIDDPYDLWCHLSDTAMVDAGSLEEFRTDMVALDQALVADGWNGDGLDIPRVLTEYWDARESIEAASGLTYPADLPGASYARGEERLSLDWARSGQVAVDDHPGGERWLAPDGTPVDTRDLADGTPEGRYWAIVTVSRDYFRE